MEYGFNIFGATRLFCHSALQAQRAKIFSNTKVFLAFLQATAIIIFIERAGATLIQGVSRSRQGFNITALIRLYLYFYYKYCCAKLSPPIVFQICVVVCCCMGQIIRQTGVLRLTYLPKNAKVRKRIARITW